MDCNSAGQAVPVSDGSQKVGRSEGWGGHAQTAGRLFEEENRNKIRNENYKVIGWLYEQRQDGISIGGKLDGKMVFFPKR